MIGSEPIAPPAGTGPAEVPDSAARRPSRDRWEIPIAPGLAVCFGLAVISVIALSWVPSSDPWAWIDWGQEIASRITGPKIALALSGGPSWKPFPVIFTGVFGLFGSTAPHLWLVVTRTAGLAALLAAFRLGKRFAGPVAGIVAVLALCLSQDWLFYFARGASEPIVAALTLWAIDRHLSGSPRVAYFLAFLATLNRPEFSPFLGLYGLYLWFRVPRSRALVLVLIAGVAFAWLVPPWVITGNPFQATSAAAGGKGSPGSAIAELRSSTALMTVPTIVLAAIGLYFAYRRREQTLLWLGAGAIAWALMVALMTQVFYGLPRYLLPAGAIACVFAGVAVVRIGQYVGDHLAAPEGGRRSAWPALTAAGLVLVATLPWSIPRAKTLGQQARDADKAAHYQQRLFTAVDRVGGRKVVLPCRSSHVAVNHSLASVLAWKLRVPLRRVRPVMASTGYVFSAPRNRDTGTTPPILHASARSIRTAAVVAPWLVLEVSRRGASATPRCAPGDRTV